ncbi:MAG TPA: pyridine nucleotide-disulfide oxidoreductase [Lachnospiraceae bacterium]|nr:pyridine nucleotide-disulfide oxidoreductase [Lachnospiraceae bacterium]
MAMVKCLVCGATFEEGADVCPVCGVGAENFISYAEEEVTFRRDTDEKFVIIGGGPAAKSAAEAIRQRNREAMITIVTQEAYLPYNRPMLTKGIVTDFGYNGLAVEGEEWYLQNNIFFMANTTVLKIDTDAKLIDVQLQDGGKGGVVYDKLIYALGAYCFVPPIPGHDLPHVVSVRSIADTERVRKIIEERKASRAVCIGGGVMGLEGAWGLKNGGLDVTVLETAPGLLPRQLDDNASAMLEDICNNAGVHIVTGAKIAKITEDAVVLEDGTEYEAQLVIMSTGMRPYTKVAEDSGIAVDKWVVADSGMRTNVPDVFAAGDCIIVNGQPQAFWAQAVATGRVAGANAAGDSLEYEKLGSSLVMEVCGTSVFALGTNGKDPDREFRAVEKMDQKAGLYEKYYFADDRLEGVILVGDISKMGEMTERIAEKAAYGDMFD